MLFKTFRYFLLFLASPSFVFAQNTSFPELKPAFLGGGNQLGRAKYLLESSTPGNKNTVKVLFYGQSITRQDWWLAVKHHLETQYPDADLVIKNYAIGGFNVPKLNKTAEHDVFPFYPDLIIFHVYGGEDHYEKLIRDFRSRTTAEIAIMNDHLAWQQNNEWHDKHSFEWLPELCEKYGLYFIDVRREWKKHLEENDLGIKDVLSDNVHLNDHGDFLMSEIVNAALDLASATKEDKIVRDFEVPDMKKNEIVFEFTGNRVDLILKDTLLDKYNLSFEVDGKKPSANSLNYGITRADKSEKFPWNTISTMQVSFKTMPLLEDWTLTLTEVRDQVDDFDFVVEGSKTGKDGVGTSKKDFVSKSGRVVINASDWYVKEGVGLMKYPVKKGDKMQWNTYPLFFDQYSLSPGTSDPAIENTIRVVQNIEAEKHVLKIKVKGPNHPFKAIRVFDPPLKDK